MRIPKPWRAVRFDMLSVRRCYQLVVAACLAGVLVIMGAVALIVTTDQRALANAEADHADAFANALGE